MKTLYSGKPVRLGRLKWFFQGMPRSDTIYGVPVYGADGKTVFDVVIGKDKTRTDISGAYEVLPEHALASVIYRCEFVFGKNFTRKGAR